MSEVEIEGDDPPGGGRLDLIAPREVRNPVLDEVGLPSPRLRTLRRACYVGYFAGLLALFVLHGVPTGRGTLAGLAITGLLISTIGRSWRHSAQVMRDWLPFTGILVLYDGTRGVADALGIGLHEKDVLDAEKWLFGGQLPTLWLQHRLYDPVHVHWYDALCTLIYASHFVTTPAVAAVLWLRDRASWLRYISRVIVLALAGLATYCLFPEAPPWLAADDGLTAPIVRSSARGWIWLHAKHVGGAVETAQRGGSNPVAAMPSLHTAFAVLAAIAIAARLRSRWRWLLALYPVAMGFTLVYTGEHYVLDLVAGVGYALVVHYGLRSWERRRAPRKVAMSVL